MKPPTTKQGHINNIRQRIAAIDNEIARLSKSGVPDEKLDRLYAKKERLAENLVTLELGPLKVYAR